MAKEYAIAKHIPIRLRRKMVGVTYTKRRGRAPRCQDGRCPMGFLPSLKNEPTTGDIAQWLNTRGINGARSMTRWDLIDIANQFVNAFDRGKIKSLREALGVN